MWGGTEGQGRSVRVAVGQGLAHRGLMPGAALTHHRGRGSVAVASTPTQVLPVTVLSRLPSACRTHTHSRPAVRVHVCACVCECVLVHMHARVRMSVCLCIYVHTCVFRKHPPAP